MQEERYHRIESYLLNQLSDEEVKQFNEELKSDSSLRDDLRVVEMTINAVEDKVLERKLEAIHQSIYPKANNTRRIIFYGVAATLLLLILGWFTFRRPSVSHEDLFTENFSPFPNYVSKRGAHGFTSLEKGFENYTTGNYQGAIIAFTEGTIPEELTLDVSFYLGLSYLASNQNDSAIATLLPLSQGDHTYSEQVTWYLALAYLKSENMIKAKEVLRQIESGQFEYNRAQKLINQLK